MRIMALDMGTKTIGVAVSDEFEITANGVTTIKRKNVDYDLDSLDKLFQQYNPQKLVVGVPYNIDGTISKRGKSIIDFCNLISERFGLKIEYWDESFSTVNAEKVLIEADMSRKKRKKVIDKLAAVVILQEYLDSKI